MFKISEHIFTEMNGKGVELNKLNSEERERLLSCIEENFVIAKKKNMYLWEQLKIFSSVQDDNAWSYIKEFVKNEKCILFFNQNEEQEMYSINTGDDLHYILSETYGFEFYITNTECSYLVCYNHHNILYGCGTAKRWIEQL